MNEVLYRSSPVFYCHDLYSGIGFAGPGHGAGGGYHGVDHTWAHHASMISSNWIR